MRRFAVLIGLSALAACSQAPEDRGDSTPSSEMTTADVAPPAMRAPGDAASGGPGVNVTAAPGVAFNYSYAFRVPNIRIAAVQEQHAQMCERLGIARCRITGMRYRVENKDRISAMLAFKLDPTIARAFGKQGVEAVTKAEGMLVDQEITGVDAGSAITQARRDRARLADDLAQIETQLRQQGLNAETRTRLTDEANRLREQIRGTRETQDAQEQSLATTPMVFNYGSGGMIPGFDARSPIREALQDAGDTAIGGIALMIRLIGALLPWLIVGLAIALLLRWLKPKWQRFAPRKPNEPM